MTVIDRMVANRASLKDLLLFVREELEDALESLPPCNKKKEDSFHAGCAVLRAYAQLFEIERRLHVLETERRLHGLETERQLYDHV